MTDKQIIIDENKINPNDWLEPYKPIPACEIKDCNHLVYAGNDVYGCRIAEDGLVCDDFNNDDECCMYRQLEYYKEALKAKEQECKRLKEEIKNKAEDLKRHQNHLYELGQTILSLDKQLDQLKAENEELKHKIFKYEELLKHSAMAQNTFTAVEVETIASGIKFIGNSLIAEENNKLHKTLTEIKEYCTDMKKDHYWGMRMMRFANEILQKISEVE